MHLSLQAGGWGCVGVGNSETVGRGTGATNGRIVWFFPARWPNLFPRYDYLMAMGTCRHEFALVPHAPTWFAIPPDWVAASHPEGPDPHRVPVDRWAPSGPRLLRDCAGRIGTKPMPAAARTPEDPQSFAREVLPNAGR